MHVIEDRFSHAKVHNELLRANQVVILGNTFEAYQVAQSARTFLDEVGRYDTKIMLLTDDKSEVRRSLGTNIERWLDL